MLKSGKRSSSVIAMENRCGICDTKLTLYPKDFAECPHCQKKICRQCWATAWPAKSFASDHCTHLAENDGLNNVNYAQKERNLNWDWPRIALAGVLALIVIGIFLFLLNLFVF
jgi:hypothetical protein